jgi:vacuolar-type H+-ATPase subunit B/Vma2
MGLTNDDYLYFKKYFQHAGVLDHIISFVKYHRKSSGGTPADSGIWP